MVVFTYAQQGKYERKSISSLGLIWEDGKLKDIDENYKTYIQNYIEIPRFDYNILPEKLIKEFSSSIKSGDDIGKVEEKLERIIIRKIVEILSDPEIQKNRALALKDDFSFQLFAATKAKSLGITIEELKIVMNSAYIYLPYITKSKLKRLLLVPIINDRLIHTIEGGIIWWNIRIDSNGNPVIRRVMSHSAEGVDAKDIGIRKLFHIANPFIFKYDRKKIEEDLYNSASMAFIRSLSIKSKQIPEFNLSAQIIETEGKNHKIALGKKEGVRLDDGFRIVEFYEETGGQLKIRNIGFGRTVKTGNNIYEPNSLSIIRQSIGKRAGIGSVLMEHPRSNFVVEFKFGQSSIFIPKTIFNPISQYGLNNLEVINDDVNTATNFAFTTSLNIASIINSTQTFLYFEYANRIVDASVFNDEVVGDNVFSITLPSLYLGFMKKASFGRSNFGIGVGIGADNVNMNGEIILETNVDIPNSGYYGFSFIDSYYGAKLSSNYEFIITPDISLNIDFSFKSAFRDSLPVIDITNEDGSTTWDVDSGNLDDWPNFVDGYTMNIGVSYCPKTIPFKWGGKLDRYRKY